jgi:hypothetical protein
VDTRKEPWLVGGIIIYPYIRFGNGLKLTSFTFVFRCPSKTNPFFKIAIRNLDKKTRSPIG